MARQQAISALGVPSNAARAICGVVADSLTATGTDQATALLLRADVNRLTTVASGTGVRLPSFGAGPTIGARPGDAIVVVNSGANAVLVYPPVGGTINALAVNASFSLSSGGRAMFVMTSPTAYFAIVSA